MKEEENIDEIIRLELRTHFGASEEQILQVISTAKKLAGEGYVYDINLQIPRNASQFASQFGGVTDLPQVLGILAGYFLAKKELIKQMRKQGIVVFEL